MYVFSENSSQAVTSFTNGELVPVVCVILDSECSTEDLKLAVGKCDKVLNIFVFEVQGVNTLEPIPMRF